MASRNIPSRSGGESPTAEILDHNQTWTVRLVRPGDRYGRNLQLVHGNDKTSLGQEPLIEFYDGKSANDPELMKYEPETAAFGQFVSQYYIKTLTKNRSQIESTGLDLPEWKISAEGMRDVFRWLDMLGLTQEKNDYFPLATSFVTRLKKKFKKVFYERHSGSGSVDMGTTQISFTSGSNEDSLYLSVTSNKIRFDDLEHAMKFVADLRALVGKI